MEKVTKQASWIIQKNLKATKYFTQAGYDVVDILTMNSFFTKLFYTELRGQNQKVSWRKLICNNLGLPRWIFVLQLAAHKRLTTRDRLHKWGATTELGCPLCEQKRFSSIAHLFF